LRGEACSAAAQGPRDLGGGFCGSYGGNSAGSLGGARSGSLSGALRIAVGIGGDRRPGVLAARIRKAAVDADLAHRRHFERAGQRQHKEPVRGGFVCATPVCGSQR
jgi:hypothetical protein